ncbi:MAG: segregation/condensation protein A [Cytophagales bacterium]|nr:segregation/condensation protein A [Bernardetiaceae bacterium]MDW8205990.1 segregation/condensation protein A [Cytophagales bacterium]
MQTIQSDTFSIRLPLFEGPFDLLLFFIERDELNIYDIPIAKITADFLDYLHHLEQINMDIASEFMVVAATLMRIKAKMLLPRPELDEKGQEIDPREELVRHLLEYKKYKSVVSQFAQREEERLAMEPRGNLLKELQEIASAQGVEAELQHLDLYKLLRVYEKVMRRFALEQQKPVHRIVPYPYTVEGQKEVLRSWIKQLRHVSFKELIERQPQKIVVIFNFLAILEMLQAGEIGIYLGEGYNDFIIFNPELPQSV